MRLTKTQIILVGIAVVIVLVVVLIFAGVIPGLNTGGGKDQGYSGTLEVWGVFDDQRVFDDTLIAPFVLNNPGVDITYKLFDSASYESELINALAAGRGPDVFMVHNSWLAKHKDKMLPFSQEMLPMSQIRSSFPEVVEKDFVEGGQAYALPLYLDTMVMIYNRGMFNNAGIASAPQTWPQLASLIPSLRRIDQTGRISVAAAAVGGSERNIDRAGDLLSLVMLQGETTMAKNNFATFTDKNGEDAVTFYTNFARPNYSTYTWDLSFDNSIDAFTQNKAAIIFNYGYQLPTIEEKNPFLDYGVAPMLQINPERPINYANYWGLAVSHSSANPALAQAFVLASTMDADTASAYLTASRRAPALRSVIEAQAGRSDALGVFSRQALTATSWRRVDATQVDAIFSQMIESILQGQLTVSAALKQAREAVNTILARYPVLQ